MFLDGVADPCSAISTGLGMDHMLSTNTVRGLGEGLDAYGLWHYDKTAAGGTSSFFGSWAPADASEEYCNKEFRSVKEKSKTLDSKIKTLTGSVAEKKDAIGKLAEDVVALQSGVKALDESVATATKNRQAEHSEFQESTTSNSAALDLLSMARDRLNKVYNPSMVAPTTTKSPYDLSFLQIKGEKPPTFEGGYQKKTQ
ncbi:unnamed protein product, partial [Durusdinium trenchii]